MQTFDVRFSPGQALVVYHTDPGFPSSEALTLLGALAAAVREGHPLSVPVPKFGRALVKSDRFVDNMSAQVATPVRPERLLRRRCNARNLMCLHRSVRCATGSPGGEDA